MNPSISGIWMKKGSFFKVLPEKGLAEKKESKASGGKKSKARLTTAFFFNAAGEKVVEPLVLWRSAKLCCFKKTLKILIDLIIFIITLTKNHGWQLKS